MNKRLIFFSLLLTSIMSQTNYAYYRFRLRPFKSSIKYKVIDTSKKTEFKSVVISKALISFTYSIGESRLTYYDGCNTCELTPLNSRRCTRLCCRIKCDRYWAGTTVVRNQLNGMLKQMTSSSLKKFLSKDHGKVFTLRSPTDKNSWVKLEKMKKKSLSNFMS